MEIETVNISVGNREITCLPLRLIIHTFGFLCFRDACAIMRVSKLWKEQLQRLLKTLGVREFMIVGDDIPTRNSWIYRYECMRCYRTSKECNWNHYKPRPVDVDLCIGVKRTMCYGEFAHQCNNCKRYRHIHYLASRNYQTPQIRRGKRKCLVVYFCSDRDDCHEVWKCSKMVFGWKNLGGSVPSTMLELDEYLAMFRDEVKAINRPK